jgi:hypothetical protein
MQLVGFCRAARTRLLSLINTQNGALRTPCRPSQRQNMMPCIEPCMAPNDVINRKRKKTMKIYLSSVRESNKGRPYERQEFYTCTINALYCMYNYVSRKCRCRENPSWGNNQVTNKNCSAKNEKPFCQTARVNKLSSSIEKI